MCACSCPQEHKLIRNQSISKLPELSEAAEQEKGNGHVFALCTMAD